MSKFFYRGKPDIMDKHNQGTYKPKPLVKLGTDANPLTLNVQSEERKIEIEAIIAIHKYIANIEVNANIAENIKELDAVLNKPKTQVFEKKPNRNDPCFCGSGKKYKKCCG
ncbi:PBPRA1643 family SWIM/SEC-C metal-binding motif protein [Pseudoalteromonas denitrificans]|uniref:SWIM/SEC-C metal-binding motif-containing protein, PBPRA1643 family n=1 Tax=Pseudoalteromonas denitrificans DSM 6059 TaxID=1123010 RepID=A0A1I1KW23_9GAMM|nr:PBPRA1643 family SWIM/SEC-C metal-binding motif protein [Pseudoalteromonas denitrificans]SFC61650.1 SWIM/SEC-C metal-binding motif-containing protein, PBPRA1643 family [Pseudoalteromonas denitrificans DSM 6059]